MCNFVSWIEKDGKNYFLTRHLVHETPRGEMVRLRFPGDGEVIGHSAIRAYFELEGGTDRECEDFSTPDNFPADIVDAIKAGGFGGFGEPRGLLTAPAEKAYEEAKATAEKAYEEAKAAAEKAYQEATAAAWKAYQEATATAWKAYQEATATALKAYEEATAPALKAYKEARDSFWDYFADPNNRNAKWR